MGQIRIAKSVSGQYSLISPHFRLFSKASSQRAKQFEREHHSGDHVQPQNRIVFASSLRMDDESKPD